MSLAEILSTLIPTSVVLPVTYYLLNRVIKTFDDQIASAKVASQSASNQVIEMKKDLLRIHGELVGSINEIHSMLRSVQANASHAAVNVDRFRNDLQLQLQSISAHRKILADVSIIFDNHQKLIDSTRQELQRERQNIKTIVKVLKNNDLLVTEDRSKKE